MTIKVADETTPIEQTPPSEVREVLAMPPTPRPSLTSSKRGKVVVVGGLFALIVVLAAALFFLFGQVSPSPSGNGIATGPSSAAAQTVQPSTTATTTAAAADAPAQVPLTEVFTFRDIFEPLIKPVSTSTNTDSNPTTSSAGNDNGSGASANSILLQDVTVEDGVPTAVVVWEGETYHVQEGDQIDGSPWQVLDIQDSSVVMLYGDTQVVLSVGQQVSK